MRLSAGAWKVKPFSRKRPVQRRRQAARRSQDRQRVSATSQQELQTFSVDYPAAMRQAQAATLAALGDGHKLIEVEFPTSSLQGVSGDAEGANEMTYSMGFLRQFCRSFQQNAAATRIFFPDKKEMEVARTGKGIEEEGGAVFDVTKFQLDYLTTPSGFLDIGIDYGKTDITTRTRETDELYIIAYPHFNVNEIIAVDELYQRVAKAADSPIVVFNGELDRIRSGYYPPFVYPKLGKLAKSFIPHFQSAYYIHNFKGSRGGVLFRAYPDPWQVLSRRGDSLTLVHTQDTMPILKDVALNIL
ncbi:hypothetical protein ABBQ38_005975 [Trebouxia sp. C0009 RCD-2024]